MATRMAQYSLSPPARPFQMRTWASCQPRCLDFKKLELTYHCDTSCESYEDETFTKSSFVWKKCPC